MVYNLAAIAWAIISLPIIFWIIKRKKITDPADQLYFGTFAVIIAMGIFILGVLIINTINGK
jgi:hypothetical protein